VARDDCRRVSSDLMRRPVSRTPGSTNDPRWGSSQRQRLSGSRRRSEPPQSARTRRARANRSSQDGRKAGDPTQNTSDDPGRCRRGCRRRVGSGGQAIVGRADAATPTPWGARDAGGSSPPGPRSPCPPSLILTASSLTPLDRQTAPTDPTAPSATRRMHRRRSVASAYISHTVAPTGHGPVFARF